MWTLCWSNTFLYRLKAGVVEGLKFSELQHVQFLGTRQLQFNKLIVEIEAESTYDNMRLNVGELI